MISYILLCYENNDEWPHIYTIQLKLGSTCSNVKWHVLLCHNNGSIIIIIITTSITTAEHKKKLDFYKSKSICRFSVAVRKIKADKKWPSTWFDYIHFFLLLLGFLLPLLLQCNHFFFDSLRSFLFRSAILYFVFGQQSIANSSKMKNVRCNCVSILFVNR